MKIWKLVDLIHLLYRIEDYINLNLIIQIYFFKIQ